MSPIIFLTAVALVTGGMHYYLWRRLIINTTRPGRARRIATQVMAALAVLLVATVLSTRVIEAPIGNALAWPGYLWLALMFYLVVILLMLEVPRAVIFRLAGVANLYGLRRTRKPYKKENVPAMVGGGPPGNQDLNDSMITGQGGEGVDRRLFLSRATAAVAGTAAVVTVGVGARIALGDAQLDRVKIPLGRLDPRLAGLRIAVVADIHLGPFMNKKDTERIVRQINAAQPDLVAIVGDLVDGTVAARGPDARPLRDLESEFGTYFVTGNHEYFGDVEEWIEELRSLNVTSLRNERVEITKRGATLDLAGVEDVNGESSGHGPDFGKALGGRDPDRSVVLLAHQPIQVYEAAGHGVDLQLSGHTHGGQMWPFHYVVKLQQPLAQGLGRFDDTMLYVTNGAGFWGAPVRVGAPPQVTIAELSA